MTFYLQTKLLVINFSLSFLLYGLNEEFNEDQEQKKDDLILKSLKKKTNDQVLSSDHELRTNESLFSTKDITLKMFVSSIYS